MTALLAQLETLCEQRGHRPRVVKVRDLARGMTIGSRRTFPKVLALVLRCRRCGVALDVNDTASWERVACNDAPPPGTPGGLPLLGDDLHL